MATLHNSEAKTLLFRERTDISTERLSHRGIVLSGDLSPKVISTEINSSTKVGCSHFSFSMLVRSIKGIPASSKTSPVNCVARVATCQPLAQRPPKNDASAALWSRWYGCGSNFAAKSKITCLLIRNSLLRSLEWDKFEVSFTVNSNSSKQASPGLPHCTTKICYGQKTVQLG